MEDELCVPAWVGPLVGWNDAIEPYTAIDRTCLKSETRIGLKIGDLTCKEVGSSGCLTHIISRVQYNEYHVRVCLPDRVSLPLKSITLAGPGEEKDAPSISGVAWFAQTVSVFLHPHQRTRRVT